jgi:broad specificity phosphatase PhoE
VPAKDVERALADADPAHAMVDATRPEPLLRQHEAHPLSAQDVSEGDPDVAAELAVTDDPRRRFQEIFMASMERWVGGRHDCEYDESWPAFKVRVNSALARLNASLAKSQGALVFTSGGPIAAVCGALLNLSGEDAVRLNSRLANAAVTKLVCSEKAIHLSTLNEHAHFEGERSAFITYR